jgi:hypothetical protein
MRKYFQEAAGCITALSLHPHRTSAAILRGCVGLESRLIIACMEIVRHMLADAVPVPASTDWATVLLLTIVWIFVAAAVTGSLVRYFRAHR